MTLPFGTLAGMRWRSATGGVGDPHRHLVAAEQLREHYRQIPAMAIAPTLGVCYTAWVLWSAVPQRWLLIGVAAITSLSALRLLLFRRFFRSSWPPADIAPWARLAVLASLLSGCLWGSAAPLLYPAANHGQYDIYLLVLLTLVPIVPVAALAAYMPAFYVYYLPCMAPFIVTLALQPGRAERLTALLLVMMMAAMLAFARRYSASLTEAIRLRLVLADKSAALEAVVRQKTQLIAAASHDLRQPVHAMGLFVATLQQQPGWQLGAPSPSPLPAAPRRDGELDAPRLLAYMDAAVQSLRGMLGNMLDISRLDADIVNPQLAVVPVHDLVHRMADQYALLALDRGLVLRCRTTEAWVRTDPVMLERVLRNLLSNALKFTRRGGIVLAVRVDNSSVRLQVVDTGIGIAPQDVNRVFEPFVRLAGNDRNASAGLGLGLAIVQRLAALLDHSLQLDTREGRGTRVTLRLARVPESALAAMPEAGREETLTAMPPGLVLLIDDDEAVATGTAALLGLWGHQVLVCASETQALARLAELGSPLPVPDLLLADLHLAGGTSGLQAVRQICRQFGRAVPVVLVTGDTAAASLRQAVEAGILMLHKPVDPLRLRAAMAEVWHLANDGPAPSLVSADPPG